MAVKLEFLDFMAKHDFQPDQALVLANKLALINITTIKDFLNYVVDRINSHLVESTTEYWQRLKDTTSGVVDRLATRSPSLVQPETRTRIRQTLLLMLNYLDLGLLFSLRPGVQRLAPHRWALLTELLAIFLGLPKGGCRGMELTTILYQSPTHSRFRWVVPDAKPTRKRKRKDR